MNLIKRSNFWTAKLSLIRTFSLISKDTESETKSPSKSGANQWIPFYKFPYIHAIVGLNKIKIYQAAFTSGGIPLTLLMESVDAIPIGTANVFAALGVTGTLALCAFSAITNNSVGFVYADSLEDPTQVRISHIDFWGKRKNTDILVNDIIPTGDQKRLPLDLWVNVRTADSKHSFKLFHRHGFIQHPHIFTWIFGEC